MEQPIDTPQAPVEGQASAGQAESTQEPQQGSPDIETRLNQIERDYKELQKDYTRKAQQLAELRRQSQSSQGSQVTQSQPQEFDWANPAQAIRQAVRGELTEFQKMQQAEREAEKLRREVAEEFNVPEREMNKYFERLVEAATDPRELAVVVARMYRADHADTAIAEAARTAQQTVERNARGVTSQGGPTQPVQQTKRPEEMTLEEHRQWLIQQFGAAPPEY